MSRARSSASGTLTGSIDGNAAAGGLLPLASGVIEASCVFKLGGTLPGRVTVYACAGLGGAGEDADGDADGFGDANGSGCGVEVGGTTAGEADGAATASVAADGLGGWLSGMGGAGGWSVAGALACGLNGSAAAASVLGFLAVGSTTGTTLIFVGSVVASGIFSATGSLYSSPGRARSSWAGGASCTTVTGCGLSQIRACF